MRAISVTDEQLDDWWHTLFHSAQTSDAYVPVNAEVQKVMDEISKKLEEKSELD